VSHEPTEGAHTIRASKGGGAGKWLIGALGAAVLAGGGYLAWKNYSPEPNTQSAYNETYADDESYRAGPLPADDDTLADDTTSDERTAAPASSERRAPARRAAARSTQVPEATIGVTPANVTTTQGAIPDDDEVIVNPPPSPVWASVPTERRLTSLYPENALQRGREGEARLQCTVLDGGSLDCARVQETSNSFGYAAMRVARTLRHAPTREDGTSAAGTPVNLRVVFRLEEEDRARFASR
jgi:TonB family protein